MQYGWRSYLVEEGVKYTFVEAMYIRSLFDKIGKKEFLKIRPETKTELRF